MECPPQRYFSNVMGLYILFLSLKLLKYNKNNKWGHIGKTAMRRKGTLSNKEHIRDFFPFLQINFFVTPSQKINKKATKFLIFIWH